MLQIAERAVIFTVRFFGERLFWWVMHLPYRLRSLWLVSFSLFVGCGTSESVQAPPTLHFDETRYIADRSFISTDETTLDHDYRFVNNSDREVRILSVTAGCSCTAIDFPKAVVRPGESGVVRLRVNLAQRRGMFETSAKVNLEGGDDSIVIQIGAYVVGPPSLRPATIHFGELAVGKSAKTDISLEVPLGPNDKLPDIQVTAVDASSGLTARVGPFELREDSDSDAKLAIAPVTVMLEPTKAAGKCEGRIDVNGMRSPVSAAVAWTSSHPTLLIEPAELVLGAAQKQSVGKVSVNTTNTGDGLEGLDVHWEGDPPKNATFRVNRVSNSSFEIDVELAAGYMDATLAIRDSPDGMPFSLRCVGYRN